MKKLALILAVVGTVSLAHATSCTLFNNVSCNNNTYSCSLPNVGPDSQVTDCTFTFSSVNCSYKGYLSCDLDNTSSTCGIGTQNGPTTTWTCTLDANGISYLNNCIASGKGCNFDLNCFGYCNVGSCTCNYDCKPTPPKTVPDASTTVALLGGALLGVEMLRRKFAPSL